MGTSASAERGAVAVYGTRARKLKIAGATVTAIAFVSLFAYFFSKWFSRAKDIPSPGDVPGGDHPGHELDAF